MLTVNPKIKAVLDPEFVPAVLWNREFQKLAANDPNKIDIVIALKRPNGTVSTFKTAILPYTEANKALNLKYVERIIKFMLWMKGGYEVVIANCPALADDIRKIYSPDGGRLLDIEEEFATPRALTSRKYLLVYDHGGSKLTVTNAYAELFSESFQNMPRYNSKGEEIGEVDLQILGASLADSGHFAVITTSNRANQLSLVWLYDNNFNLIQCFGRGSDTLGVALSPNGSRVAILGADAQSGEPLTKVDVFSLGATKPDESLALQGEVPLSISFVTNQSIALLTNKTLYFLNNRLEIKESVSLEGRAIVGFAANGEGVALALEENALTATKRLMSFTTDGKELLNTAFVGEIGAMSLYDRTLFLLSDRSVVRFVGDSDEAERLEISAGAYDIFAVSARGVRVVYPAKADYLKFD